MSESLLTAPEAEIDKAAAAAAALPRAEAARPPGGRTADGRPPYIPEKFWDAETGTVRLEHLARSYRELEKRLHGSVTVPGPDAGEEERRAFHRACGVPEGPDGYEIAAPHPLLEADPEVNARLHGAGFTPEQAQVVYDLAAERVLPVIETLAAEFEADRQLVRLIDHFGGEERWEEVSRQILAWGRSNLPKDVLDAMSTTTEGVLALHRMMASGEPGLRGGSGGGDGPMSEDEVKRLMRDPKYWRDRDPAVVRRVSDGFKRLYGAA